MEKCIVFVLISAGFKGQLPEAIVYMNRIRDCYICSIDCKFCRLPVTELDYQPPSHRNSM